MFTVLWIGSLGPFIRCRVLHFIDSSKSSLQKMRMGWVWRMGLSGTQGLTVADLSGDHEPEKSVWKSIHNINIYTFPCTSHALAWSIFWPAPCNLPSHWGRHFVPTRWSFQQSWLGPPNIWNRITCLVINLLLKKSTHASTHSSATTHSSQVYLKILEMWIILC